MRREEKRKTEEVSRKRIMMQVYKTFSKYEKETSKING